MIYINEKRLDKNFMESQLCFKTHFPINFGHKNVKSVFKKEKKLNAPVRKFERQN